MSIGSWTDFMTELMMMSDSESERDSPQVRRTDDGNDIEIQQGVVGLLISDDMAEELIEDLERVVERDR